jgi:hypothetical protein
MFHASSSYPLRTLLLLGLLGLTAGCGPKPPSAKSLHRNELMVTLFPQWTEKVPHATLMVSEDNKKTAPPSAEDFEIHPDQVVRLSEDRAVMITAAAPLDENGKAQDSTGTQGLLSAFWFKRDGDVWLPDGRQDQVDWVGTHGNAGGGYVAQLGGKFVMTAGGALCTQGYCSSWLDVYALGPDKVSKLTKESIELESDNEGVVDCTEAFEQPDGKPVRHEEGGSRQACFRSESKWTWDKSGGALLRLVLNITNTTETRTEVEQASAVDGDSDAADASENGPYISTVKRSHDKAVYEMRGPNLVLVKGKNTVHPT